MFFTSALRKSKIGQFLGKHALFIILVLAILSLIYQYYLRAINYSLFFNEVAIDGAFQLFNPLRRMAAGQIPGQDFQFFHGIGIVYLHYLPFILMGKNLSASEFARWFISPCLFLLANLFFFLAVRIKKEVSFLLTLSVSFVFYYLLGFQSLFYPISSLISARSIMPLVSFGILVVLFRSPTWYQKTKRFFLFEAVAGLLGALCFFFSIEHGIAVLVGLSAMFLLFPVERVGKRSWLAECLNRGRSLGIFLIWYLFFLLGIHFIATGGAVLQTLKYELISVPSDQFWYFGAPPNGFLGGKIKIWNFKLVMARVLLGLVIFLPLLLWRYRQQKKSYLAEESLFLFLIIYGLASCMGYLGIANEVYTLPLARIELLITLFWLARSTQSFQKLPFVPPKYIQIGMWSATGLFLIIIGIRYWKIPYEYRLEKFSLDYAAQKTSGTYLNSEWNESNTLMLKAIGPVGSIQQGQLWSTYAGLLESEYGVYQPDTDYIIHPLGEERRQHYIQSFVSLKPEYVTTINRSYTVYEEWLQDTTWGLYGRLVRFYDPITLTTQRVVWKKKSNDFTLPNTWTEQATYQKNFQIYVLKTPTSIQTKPFPALEVHVEYEIHNPWEKVPFLGKLPRYLLQPLNARSQVAISLPPYEREVTFPLFLRQSADAGLRLQVEPGFWGTSVKIKKIEYRALEASEKNIWALLGDPGK